MVKIFLLIMGSVGAIALLKVGWDLFFPKLIPVKAQSAKFKILGAEIQAPEIFIFGIAAIAIASITLDRLESPELKIELENTKNQVKKSSEELSLLNAMVITLEDSITTLQPDTSHVFVKEIKFGAAVSLPQLGPGVTVILKNGSASSQDSIQFEGIDAIAEDLNTGFVPVYLQNETSYQIGKRFFIRSVDRKIWGINIMRLAPPKGICAEFFLVPN